MNDHTHTFARFWKCALQVNTAGYSEAYRGTSHGLSESEYNAALANRCKELNIDVVGIADHGGIDRIDSLRRALQSVGLVVFPGFEISSTEKIHMVCLFPEVTNRDELNRYLGSLELTRPEETVWPSPLGCQARLQERACSRDRAPWLRSHCRHSPSKSQSTQRPSPD